MDINRENYTRSLENIKPSEKFLAETKKLMLEEAAKNAMPEKPRRKPLMIKLTPLAAAACIALIAVVGVNVLKDKSLETVQSGNGTYSEDPIEKSDETMAETTAVSSDEIEESTAPVIIEEKINEIPAEDKSENREPDSEPSENEPALFAANTADSMTDTAADDTAANDAAIDSVFPEDEWSGAENISPESNDETVDPYDDTDGSTDGGSHRHYNDYDDTITDTDDDTDEDGNEHISTDTPVAPAFSKLSGGKASAYPDFSPSDKAALCEFLSLISQDDINAEVTSANGENTDIFGESALVLNDTLAKAAKNFRTCDDSSFAPTFSFIVFDNLSGETLYTFQTDGNIISVQIKNGETAYFSADKTVIESIVSASKR